MQESPYTLKQHVKSLRRRFSQFNTKFDVGPLFNTHYCDIQHKKNVHLELSKRTHNSVNQLRIVH